VAATAPGRLSRRRDLRLPLLTLGGGGLALLPIAAAQQWWLLLLRPLLDLFIGGTTTLTYAIAPRALPEQWKLTAIRCAWRAGDDLVGPPRPSCRVP